MILMNKTYIWLLAANVIIGIFYFSYFDSSSMYGCGKTEVRPNLSLGLSPSWFSGNFQIRRGYKEIISTTESENPLYDKWVKGSEQFKTITAYDVNKSDDGLLFKALNWNGVEQIFILRERSPSVGEEYIYEVNLYRDLNSEPHWVNVSEFSCREGIYKYLGFLLLMLILVINVVILLKFVRTNKSENS